MPFKQMSCGYKLLRIIKSANSSIACLCSKLLSVRNQINAYRVNILCDSTVLSKKITFYEGVLYETKNKMNLTKSQKMITDI